MAPVYKLDSTDMHFSMAVKSGKDRNTKMKNLKLFALIAGFLFAAPSMSFADQGHKATIEKAAQSLVTHADHLNRNQKEKAYAKIVSYLTKNGSLQETDLVDLSEIATEVSNKDSQLYNILHLNHKNDKNFVESWSQDTGEDMLYSG